MLLAGRPRREAIKQPGEQHADGAEGQQQQSRHTAQPGQFNRQRAANTSNDAPADQDGQQCATKRGTGADAGGDGITAERLRQRESGRSDQAGQRHQQAERHGHRRAGHKAIVCFFGLGDARCDPSADQIAEGCCQHQQVEERAGRSVGRVYQAEIAGLGGAGDAWACRRDSCVLIGSASAQGKEADRPGWPKGEDQPQHGPAIGEAAAQGTAARLPGCLHRGKAGGSGAGEDQQGKLNGQKKQQSAD